MNNYSGKLNRYTRQLYWYSWRPDTTHKSYVKHTSQKILFHNFFQYLFIKMQKMDQYRGEIWAAKCIFAISEF